MKRRFHIKAALFCASTALCMSLSSCFTGVEGTKTVTLSREDIKAQQPSAETQLLADIKLLPAGSWLPGKEFMATESRLAYLMEMPPEWTPADSIGRRLLIFMGMEPRMLPDGSTQAMLLFQLDGAVLRLPTGKSPEATQTGYYASMIPMLVDMDIVERTDSVLRGRKMYTRSQLWYDACGEKIPGRKFVPVEITGVKPGTTAFPLNVEFRDADGATAYMPMNYGASGFESRSLESLFSIDDPRRKHANIPESHWEAICNGKVLPGMTKEECRLSLGNPSDVNAGHSYSQTLDIWQYPDGRVLRFADGLLVDFNFR